MIQSNVRLTLALSLLAAGTGAAALFFFNRLQHEPAIPAQPLPIAATTIHIETDRAGIYRLTPTHLRASGVPLYSWDLQQVALTYQGETVPVTWVDADLLFYAPRPDSIYTPNRTYQLHIGNRIAAERVDQAETEIAASALAGSFSTQQTQTTVDRRLVLEENVEYISLAHRQEAPDTWFWKKINIGQAAEIGLELPHIGDGSGRLQSELFGISYDKNVALDHDLDLFVNQLPLESIAWDGQNRAHFETEIPVGYLKDNSLLRFDNTVAGASFVDVTALDRLALLYDSRPLAHNGTIEFLSRKGELTLSGFGSEPIVLDITDPARPELIDGRWAVDRGTVTLTLPPNRHILAADQNGTRTPLNLTVSSPTNLADGSEPVDFLIVTTAELAPALEPLRAARQAEGLATMIVLVEEIYTEFGFGEPSPLAIQSFLHHVKSSWPAPAPTYLLLVGSSSYDYRNYLGESKRNQVPSLMIGVTHSGETVSDARMADIDGDGRADFRLGRWPVETVDQVEGLVERTLAYAEQTIPTDAFFVADHSEPDFASMSDRLIDTFVGTDTDTDSEAAGVNRNYGNSYRSVKEMSSIGQDGYQVVTYVGHGSIDLWGRENLLSNESVATLFETSNKAEAPPIVLQLTCLTGFFAHPTERSISEEMLLDPNGPVMIISATSLTYSSSQEPFAHNFLAGLGAANTARIGDLVHESKLGLNLQNRNLREVNDTFNLLGDPTLRVGR